MILWNVPLWVILQAAATTVLPLLVGLVTSKVTEPGLKSILLAGLALLTSLAGQTAAALETHQPYNLGLALIGGLVTFAISVGLHYGIWKPTGASDALQSLQILAQPATDSTRGAHAAGVPSITSAPIPADASAEDAAALAAGQALVASAQAAAAAPITAASLTPPA